MQLKGNDVMILVGGENLMDMIQTGHQNHNALFEAVPGGSPYNLAMAVGRQGANVGYITPISEDIDITFATDEEWIDWRIHNIYPIYPNELSEKYTPYNCGLDEYVHTGKGCYTGQEILTRMKSRNSFGRTLKVVDNDKLNAEIPTSTGSIASLVISKN